MRNTFWSISSAIAFREWQGTRLQEDVIKWKHFPRCWPFVRGIHRSPANSPHKGQWRGALMFSLIWAWVHRWVHNCEAGDLKCHRAHYDVIVMFMFFRLLEWCLCLLVFISSLMITVLCESSRRFRGAEFRGKTRLLTSLKACGSWWSSLAQSCLESDF